MDRVGSVSFAIALCTASAAHAEVPAHLTVEGTCPTREAFAAATEAWLRFDATDEPALEIELRRAGRVSTLRIHRPGEGSPLLRRVVEDDCAGIAEVLSVIVHAHLLELRLIEPEPPEPPLEAPTLSPTPAEPAVPSEPTPASESLRLGVGVRLDGGLSLEPAVGWVGGGLVLEIAPPAASVLALRIEGRVLGVGDQASEGYTIHQLGGDVLAGAGLRHAWDGGWVQGILTAGAQLISVSLSGLSPEVPPVVRALPIIGLSLEVGLAETDGFAFVLRVGVAVLPAPERYVIEPVGPIGQSSVVIFTAGIGGQWDLFFRS